MFSTFTILGTTVSNLNASIGPALSAVPLPSPASGIIFTVDPQLGVATRSAESFGPILTERAETLGSHRLLVGFAYQHFGFDDFEGTALKAPAGTNLLRNLGLVTSIDEFSVDQYTTFVSFGLTRRLDVSAVIPFRRVNLRARGFTATLTRPELLVPSETLPNPNEPTQASGIADVVFRVKGTAWRGERGGVALGVDVRAPSGDELNFLGTGAWGGKPFIAASYGTRLGPIYIAPHVNVGYEFNGTSIMGGALTGLEGRLPRRLEASVGTEVGILKRATLTLDLTGQRLFSARRTLLFTPNNPLAAIVGGDQVIESTLLPTSSASVQEVATGPVNMKDASVGLKVNPFGNLLVTGNVTFKLDNGGLRDRITPLVGASYTF